MGTNLILVEFDLHKIQKEKSSIRVNVGDRCVIVSPKGDPDRVGTVQFAGVAHEGGVWVSIPVLLP